MQPRRVRDCNGGAFCGRILSLNHSTLIVVCETRGAENRKPSLTPTTPENARIHDCMITYNKGTGLNLNVNNHDTIVSANHFEENFDGLRSGDGFNLTMTGNNLDDHLGSAVIIEKMMGSVVTGNMLEQSVGWGIVVDRDTYATTFTGNTLTNNAAGGIDLRDAHGCTISANTFSRTVQNSLVVRKDSGRLTVSGTVSHCLFTNNLLVDCASDADQLLKSEIGMNVSMPGE